MKWTLEEFATKCNVSIAEVEKYVAAGLLPTNGNQGAEMAFDDSDNYWMGVIQCFVGNGTSIDELKQLIGHCKLS